MKTRLIALFLALSLTAAPVIVAAAAEEKPPAPAPTPMDEAAEAARRAAEAIVRALQSVLESIPQYSAPEVLPNGDIIIRRKHPQKPPEPLEKPKETRT